MLKVVKVRLYPTPQQQQLLEQSFGNCRWLWNYGLNLINQTYQLPGKGLSGYDIKKLIPQLKKEHQWLTLTYSQCLQQVCLNLGVALKNFFEKRANSPRFKSKNGKPSIQYPQNVKVAEKHLTLPKIGEVSAIIHRTIEGKIKTVTLSKNCSNQYFAAILFDDGKEKPSSSTEGKAIGIDLGLTHLAVTSDGSKFDNPRILKKYLCNLKLKQQQLSRKQKGSNNRNKARKKVARVHRKITKGLRILTRQSPQVEPLPCGGNPRCGKWRGKPVHGAGSSGTGDKACRPDVSRSNRGRKKSTTVLSVGQEAHTDP